MEAMTGIEPAYSAWEADVLPLNYIGATALSCGNLNSGVSLAVSDTTVTQLDSNSRQQP